LIGNLVFCVGRLDPRVEPEDDKEEVEDNKEEVEDKG
jgi:hypothetical protein